MEHDVLIGIGGYSNSTGPSYFRFISVTISNRKFYKFNYSKLQCVIDAVPDPTEKDDSNWFRMLIKIDDDLYNEIDNVFFKSRFNHV